MKRAEKFEDDEDLDDDDSDDDSDDDDSEDGNIGGVSSKAFIIKLEADLQVAPFNAESHAALISALREAANLDRLRTVRRRAVKKVPLTEPLWFEWLQDETNLADDKDFEELLALHEMACSACPLSSRIWLARSTLVQGQSSGKADGPGRIRAVFESALDVLGLHPTEGLEIWGEYRTYEETLLHELDGKPPHDRKMQVQRVRTLFLRQLALPLPGLERLREAFMTFDSSLDASLRDPMASAKAEAIMEEGAAGWTQREALEKRLMDASRPSVSIAAAGSVDVHMQGAEISAEVLALEEASGDAKRIFLGHLRATHWAPFSEQRWRALVQFVTGTLKDDKQLVNVLANATRNCPQCQEFWLAFHLARESSGASLVDLKELVEHGMEALQSGGAKAAMAAVQELLLQHADACRRAADLTQMRENCQRAVSISEGQVSENGLACQALLHWMRLEAYGARSEEKTLEVGNRLMKFWGGCYNVWSAFVAAVRYCAGSESYSIAHDLFVRAVAEVSDYPSQIRTDYVQFERECGTLWSWREAREAEVQFHQSTEQASASTVEPGAQKESMDASQADAEATAKKRDKVNVSGQEKKKRRRLKEAQETEEANADAEGVEDSSKKVPAAEKSPQVSEPEAKAAPVDKKESKAAEAKLAPADKKAAKAARLVAASEAKMAALAGKKGDAQKSVTGSQKENPVIEVVKSQTEPSKPKSEAQAVSENQAVSADKQDASENQAVSADKQDAAQSSASGEAAGEAAEVKVEAHHGSHYHQKRGVNVPLKPEEEGKQTVYVSNLDWSVDDNQLSEMFGSIPGMKEVRLVRDFLKRPKGYAYVDFQKTEQVDKAIKQYNGFMLNKRAMFVARSLPTKALFEEKTVFVKNIGAKVTESDIRDAFAVKGEVLGVRLPMDDGKHKGHAYVEFSTAESTTAALTLDGAELGGQKVCVARSIPMKDHRHQTAAGRKDMPQRSNQHEILQDRKSRQDGVKNAENCATTIYVKNLAFRVNEEKLKAHFSECGEVTNIMLVKNAKGQPRGFGFVEFANSDQVQAALAYNDSVLCGREIWVSKSQRAITLKGMTMGVADGAKKVKADDGKEKGQGKDKGPSQGAKRRLDLGEKKKDPEVEKKEPEVTEPAKKQFRSAQGKAQAPAATNGAGEQAKATVAAPEPEVHTPMSNADFKKLMMG